MDGADLALSAEMASLPVIGGLVICEYGDDVQVVSLYVSRFDGLVEGTDKNSSDSPR